MFRFRARLFIRYTLSIVFIYFGVKMILPSRNVKGNAALEDLIEHCKVGSYDLRLYRGGGGATVANWSSVTAQKLSREHQIFYAYSEPEVAHIVCSDLGVLLLNGSGAHVSEIRVNDLEERADNPLLFFDGQPTVAPTFAQEWPIIVPVFVFGALLTGAGLWLFFSALRRHQAALKT